jgi:hypothetical protein
MRRPTVPAKKIATTRATSSKATAKKGVAVKRSAGSMPARRGDHIVVDSPHVGSPPREGEVLKVIVGDVSVSYRVKWSDGHETLIAPVAGVARIVRA